MNLDSVFGIHEKALDIRSKRTEILASNMANSDTPGYKARDIDFKSVFSNAMNDNGERLVTTNGAHITDNQTILESEVKYRVPLQTKADGNTVDNQVENAKFAENSMRYIASIKFLDMNIKNLMLSLRGE